MAYTSVIPVRRLDRAVEYYKGEILQKMGREDEAAAQFKKATRRLRIISTSNRTFYECYLFRALAHKNIKEYSDAIEMDEYIVSLQPDRADGYVILADIYKEIGDLEKSEKQYQIAEQKEPGLKRKG